MTDRDRLIELLKKADSSTWGQTYESYADYLLANGVIVPPCKVGDKVYQTDGVKVYEGIIKKIVYDAHIIVFDETAIGKSIFLTKEEAEAKLKELGNNDK